MNLPNIPKATSSLSMWLSYIENLHHSSIDLGLTRIKSVANTLELTKPAPVVITVAGTNGKGSTCAMMESILLHAGYKVGVYSSPHLIHYKERVRINNQLLPDEDYCEVFSIIEAARQEHSLSFFEYGTLAALSLFKKQPLDVVILEVGLGGRLDATNIVEHDVSIITSLAIDHVDWLGDDIEVIGFEKAGIFRSNKPAICGQVSPPSSVENHAKSINAQLYQVNKDFSYELNCEKDTWQWQHDDVTFSNLPKPNLPIENAATALMGLTCSGLDFKTQDVIQGLKEAKLQGRMQILSQDPFILLDVAHNPHSAKYLAKQLKDNYANKTIHCVVGMLKDKDIKHTLLELQPLVTHWYLSDLEGERAASAADLNVFIASKNRYHSPIQALENAIKNTQNDNQNNDIILVMGSFHTVGEVIAYWQKISDSNKND